MSIAFPGKPPGGHALPDIDRPAMGSRNHVNYRGETEVGGRQGRLTPTRSINQRTSYLFSPRGRSAKCNPAVQAERDKPRRTLVPVLRVGPTETGRAFIVAYKRNGIKTIPFYQETKRARPRDFGLIRMTRTESGKPAYHCISTPKTGKGRIEPNKNSVS